MSQDCYREDNMSVLPADHINLIKNDPIGDATENHVVSTTLWFHFADVPPGHYIGKVAISEESPPSGKTPAYVEIPVTVTVKAGWWVPAILLLLSILSSFVYAWYRSQRQPQDQTITGIGQLQSAIEADPELSGNAPRGQAFRKSMQDNLDSAVLNVRARRWEAAYADLQSAWALWDKWTSYRAGWVEQLDRLQQYRNQIGLPASLYLQAVKASLDAAEAGATSQPDANTLQAQIDPLADQLTSYYDLRSLVNSVPAGQQAAFILRLDSLNPADAVGLSQLRNDIVAARPAGAPPLPGAAGNGGMPGFAPRPAAQLDKKAVWAAQRRLALAFWGSYALALILIFISGYYALYDQNPTFGALPFRDYSSMLLFGFGADTLSRSAIMSTVSGFNLPGLSGLPILHS